ncbi:MAG: hypothetical protein AB7S41_01370 [Parvibaculaceae bacterium]
MPKTAQANPQALRHDIVPQNIVPLDINAGAFAQYRDKDPDPALDAIISAVQGARDAAERVATARTAILQDQSITEQARAMKARALVANVQQKHMERFARAHAQVSDAIAMLKQRMAIPAPLSQMEADDRREVRRAFAQIPQSGRFDLLLRFANVGQDSMVHALLGTEAFVLGIEPDQHAALVERWQRRRFPREFDQAGRLSEALAQFVKTGKTLVTFLNTLGNIPQAPHVEETAKRAAAAIAALDGN